MTEHALTIKTLEGKDILNDITALLSEYNANITYTHLFIDSSGQGTINIEFEGVDNVEKLINDIKSFDCVISVCTHDSSNDIFGKRIIIIGGGAQVSQAALGAITEADRHNIRGERIGIDTIPLVGENAIAEAVEGLSRLPRVHALILAGSLMGGKITSAVEKLKEENEILVICLNMPGSITKVADLVITDPIQAGVMAVMGIADTAVFDIERLDGNTY